MKFCKGFAALLLFSMLLVPSAHAQLDITVDTVDTSNFPTIKVDVVTRFSNVISRDFDSTHFRLIEDGIDQGPLHYSCPSPTKSFSLTIVIAVGSSMSAGDIGFAKGVASRIVQRMNGLSDEASVLRYDGNQLLQQEFTHIIPLLTQRIDALTGTGGDNHMWDGVYSGVSYCANDGVHLSRGVLVLSNGKGDGGSKNLNDVITLAKAAKIPVYCLGINAVGNDQDMRNLADQTGGKYFNNADQTVQELVDALNGTPPHCTLEYTTNNLCRDGVARDLEIRLRKDNDSTDVTYNLPLTADASTNAAVTLQLDTGTVTTGIATDLSLMMMPAVQDQRLYDGSIELSFDTSALKLQGVSTAGHLADGVAANAAMTATGARITFTGTARLNGSGTLMMLSFTGGSVQASTVVSVAVSDFQQSRGCLAATLAAANVTVIPKRASITTSAAPVIFTWDNTTKRYDPDPGVINVEVTNNGDLPVTGLSATLDEAAEIRMAYNGSRTVAVSPLTLEPGKKGTATFFVQALPQESETTAQVNAVVTSAEGAQATQRLFLNIKPAGSAYRVTCEAAVITISGGNYTPDPAEVRVTVTSAGTTDSPAGDVTIVLPPELTLSGGNATQSFAAMAPGSGQTHTWPVEYPTPAVKTDYEIMFVTASAGYTDDTCRTVLTVPVLTAAQLMQSCRILPEVIDSTMTFDPFAVETTVRNDGNADAYGVAAEISLQAGFTLRTGETVSKILADTLAPGDSVTVSWTIRRVMGDDGCTDEQFDINVYLATNNDPAGSCTASGTLQYPVNLLPEITQVTPAVLDTTDKDTEVQFSVRATDREQATLTYKWYVDGSAEGSSSESFAWTFDAVGDVEVKVEIYDPCTLVSNTPVVHTWNFHVRDLTGIADDPAALADFAITGNYPNPFNPGTVIEYRLPAGRHHVRLDVIDAYGRVVRSLLDEEQTGGSYRRAFDATGLPSGTYIARLTTGGVARMHRMVLVK